MVQLSSIVLHGKYRKDIPNYVGSYQVTEYGEIISLPKKWKRTLRVIKPCNDQDGYHHVALSGNGIRKTYRIHQLVAKLYLDNPHNHKQVNHIDGDKKNNHYKNLEWCSPHDNIKHAYSIGIMKAYGENNNQAKLTEQQVREIFVSKESYSNISRQYNIVISQISQIKRRKAWRHLTI